MAALQQLAELVGGRVVGDSGVEILRVAPIDRAGEDEITFLTNPKYLPLLDKCKASAVIVTPGVEVTSTNLVICSNPYLAFAKILTHLQCPPLQSAGVLPGAYIAESARYGENVTIHPGCVVGENVTIGNGATLFPGVIIYNDVVIGDNCILHAGSIVREECQLGDRVILQPSAIIGSDGFGFAPDGTSYYKIPQVGIVVLEDDVEIGACCCIDRAALGETRIQRGTKLDNMVHIAHNVTVGEDTVITAQVGIAGSSRVGNHCTFGGQSGVVGHVKVGDNVTIGGRGVVANNLEVDGKNTVFSGFPAIPHKTWLKAAMTLSKLPEMRKKISKLEKQLEQLESVNKES